MAEQNNLGSIEKINRSATLQIKLGEAAMCLSAYQAYLASDLERYSSGISAGVLLGVSIFGLREGILRRGRENRSPVDATGDNKVSTRAMDILAEL